MEYKRLVHELVEKIADENKLERIYKLVLYLYLKEED